MAASHSKNAEIRSTEEDENALSPSQKREQETAKHSFRLNLSPDGKDLNADKGFPNNVYKTSKYTIATFLPLNLFEQFRRIANSYFLFIIILMAIPGVSVSTPKHPIDTCFVWMCL